jgi:hypothetical protein
MKKSSTRLVLEEGGAHWPISAIHLEGAMRASQMVLSFKLTASDESLTVRWRLFQTAGKIVRHGRQIFLQIGAAMLDMFAAIRERCASIMREGGAIPETS